MKPGSAATAAETRKKNKYESLSRQYTFVPVAIESHGAWGPSAFSLVTQLGRRIFLKSGEDKAVAYLQQSISMAIQRGNCKLLHDSYQKGELLDFENFEGDLLDTEEA